MKSNWLWSIIWACILYCVSAETIFRPVKFIGNDKFCLLSKFVVGAGNIGKFDVKGRFVTPFGQPEDQYKLDVLFYEDSHWKRVHQTNHWFDRKELNNTSSEIVIKGNGEWSKAFGVEIDILSETHIWYATVVDCEGTMHLSNRNMPMIEFELTMKNDNSHFSFEDQYTLILFAALLLLFVWLLGRNILYFYYQSENYKASEDPIVYLMIGTFADLWWIVLMFVHLYIFNQDGQGIYILTVLSRFSYMISQILITWIILIIVYGWTISFKSINDRDHSIILILFVLMVHVMIAGLTFFDKDDYHKFHDFSWMQGVITILLRFILYSAFIYGYLLNRNWVKFIC